MLTIRRVIDVSEIDINNSEVHKAVEDDFKKFRGLKHKDIPEGADTYVLKVKYSKIKPPPGFYLFNLEVQYGILDEDGKRFYALSKPFMYWL